MNGRKMNELNHERIETDEKMLAKNSGENY
jgi:hypothetical protein